MTLLETGQKETACQFPSSLVQTGQADVGKKMKLLNKKGEIKYIKDAIKIIASNSSNNLIDLIKCYLCDITGKSMIDGFGGLSTYRRKDICIVSFRVYINAKTYTISVDC